MLCCIVFCCAVLCCAVLCCAVLGCELCCAVCCVVLCVVLCAVLCCAVLCVVLCCAVCCVVLCCAFCCVVLCCPPMSFINRRMVKITNCKERRSVLFWRQTVNVATLVASDTSCWTARNRHLPDDLYFRALQYQTEPFKASRLLCVPPGLLTFLLTYLLTYSMVHSPSSEANRFSAS